MAKWRLTGDYFENCNCDVVCPCLVSTAEPLTARPTQGVCDVALVFHIDKGDYNGVALDGLNVAVVAHTPGPWPRKLDARRLYRGARRRKQTAALGAIFGGGEGGPMAAFAPLVGKIWAEEGADQIRDQRQVARWNSRHHAFGGRAPSQRAPHRRDLGGAAIRLRRTGSPSPSADGSTFADHGMRWDNSGKNGHYAPINWSN